MAVSLGDGDGIVGIGADLLHLIQGRAGHHEGDVTGGALFRQLLPPQGQPVAVYRHHGQGVRFCLKQGAGVNGTALIIADGENGLGDHGFQTPLGEDQAGALINAGKLWKILVAVSLDIKGGRAALDVDRAVGIGVDGHRVVGHTTEDLPQQTGGQDDSA